MAITYIGSAVPGGNPTTSFTITIPTVQVGDLLILSVQHRATTAPTVTDNDTGGNTWTRKTTQTVDHTIWYKRATSATSAKTITAGSLSNSGAGVLVVLRGAVASGDPFHQHTVESNLAADES